MKKLISVFAVVVVGSFFSACEQEEIAPVDAIKIDEVSLTDGGEDEEDGGVKSN